MAAGMRVWRRFALPRGLQQLNPPRMKAAYLAAAGLFLAAVSCERHEWEETKVLHESHGGHEGGDHAEHADGEHADHEGDAPADHAEPEH